MTEYGRGPGSEPWHPEDPLYGDGGWGGQQAARSGQQPPYGGQHAALPAAAAAVSAVRRLGATVPAAARADRSSSTSSTQQYQQQYPQQYSPAVPAAAAAAPVRPAAVSSSYPTQRSSSTTRAAGWATATHGRSGRVARPTRSGPVRRSRPAALRRRQQPTTTAAPGRAARRRQPQPSAAAAAAAPAPSRAGRTDWDPGPDQGEHAFFAGADDDERRRADDEPRTSGRGGRAGRGGEGGKGGKKRRSGCACLVVARGPRRRRRRRRLLRLPVLPEPLRPGPGLRGAGQRRASRWRSPRARAASRSANILKEAGVVKSVDAFVAAAGREPEGQVASRRASTSCNKQMSGARGREMMLDPKSQNNLIIAEGLRDARSTQLIDKKLGLATGTTEKVAKKKAEPRPARLGGRRRRTSRTPWRASSSRPATASARARSPRTC